MILRIDIDGTVYNVDVGDLSAMSSDEKTDAVHTAMTDAGLDINKHYIILGEAE
jgi:hypothetical protein